MTFLILVLLTMVGLLLQSTVFNCLTIAGAKPDFVLILIIFYSIILGYKKGTAAGFILGLLEDIYLGRFIGMNALVKGLTAFVAGWFTRGAFTDNLFVPIITTFLSTLFSGFIFLALGKIAGLQWALSLWIWKSVPAAIYNTCLVPFLYTWFYYWLMKNEKEISLSFWERLS